MSQPQYPQQQPGWGQPQHPGWPPPPPKKNNTGLIIALVCLGVLGLAVLFGIIGAVAGGEDDPPDAAKSTPSIDTSKALKDAGIPPKPDAVTAKKYTDALIAIDPDIVHGKPDKAISRGRSQCSSYKTHGDDRAKLIELTTLRFTSPDHPEGFGAAKAEKILDAVHKHLCPDF